MWEVLCVSDEWCHGLWVALGLFCQSGHFRLLLCPQSSTGSSQWVSYFIKCCPHSVSVLPIFIDTPSKMSFISTVYICVNELFCTVLRVWMCLCVSTIESSLRSARRPRLVEISRNCVRSSSLKRIWRDIWIGSHKLRTSTLIMMKGEIRRPNATVREMQHLFVSPLFICLKRTLSFVHINNSIQRSYQNQINNVDNNSMLVRFKRCASVYASTYQNQPCFVWVMLV